MRHYSTAAMIERLAGLLDTADLNDWEQEFVRKLDSVRKAGEVTKLTDRQVEKLDELHGRHFS